MKLPLVDGEEQSSYDPMGEKLKMMSSKHFLEEQRLVELELELEDEEEVEDEELAELITARDFRVSWEHRFSPRYSFHDTSKPFNFLSSFFQLLPPQSTSTRDCFCKSIYLCPLIMFRIAIIFYTHTHTPH